MGLMYYSTTKFENDANRPSCIQQLQAVTGCIPDNITFLFISLVLTSLVLPRTENVGQLPSVEQQGFQDSLTALLLCALPRHQEHLP